MLDSIGLYDDFWLLLPVGGASVFGGQTWFYVHYKGRNIDHLYVYF